MAETGYRGGELRQRPITPPAELPQYSYSWLMPVLGALAALVLAFAVYKLHYTYGQAPHRIVKMLVGVIVVLAAAFKPRFALHAWLLAMPIGEWLPASGIPGLNGPNLLFLVMLGAWIVPRVMGGGHAAVRTGLTRPLGIFIAVLFVSLLRAELFPPGGVEYEGVAMLKAVWQSVLGLAIYFVVINTVESERQIKHLLVTMSIGCIVGALIALRQFAGAVDAERIAGALGDVNDLGAYFAMAAAFLIGVYYASGGFGVIRRTIILAGAGLSSIAVFLPKSRGAFLGFGVALGLLTYLMNRRALIIFLVVAASSPLWAPEFVKERVAETRVESFEVSVYGDATDRLDPSAAVRLEIWGVVLAESLRSPLIGHGYGTVPYLTMNKFDRPWSSHSLYVETMGEAGLIGFAVLIWLLTACVRSGFTLLRTTETKLGRGLAIGFLSATAALIIANIFGQRFTHISIAGTYFYGAALVDRMTIIERGRLSAAAGKGVGTS
ncbi:O-antigen ligase family protein [bacterium]|nr:O-antigen ligase family protein [bacterium]